MPPYTVPGMSDSDAKTVRATLQDRLVAMLDLSLTLKHVHWNVVGANFIAVHEMIDPQVDTVRQYSDALAERIATLGGEPLGTPGAITEQRRWDDYDLNRAVTTDHLEALDAVYQGIIADHRKAIADLEGPDPVSQDIMIGQAAQLELFHWFIRAHLEDKSGNVKSR